MGRPVRSCSPGSRPGSEAELLPLAKQSGLSKVRDRAQRVNAIPADELHNHQRAATRYGTGADELGMVAGTFRLTPDIGVPFVNRLEREQNAEAAQQGGAETVERFEAYAADAFAEMVQPTAANEDEAARRRCRRGLRFARRPARPRGRRGAVPPRRRRTNPGASRTRDGQGRVPQGVLHDGVNIHTVKHFGRHIPAELRTASRARTPAGPRRRGVLRRGLAIAATASSGTTTTRSPTAARPAS